MTGAQSQLETLGVTDIMEVLEPALLEGLQAVIFDLTKHNLNFESVAQDGENLASVLREPFGKPMDREGWLHLVRTVKASPEFAACVQSQRVRELFSQALGGEVEYFPITFFRARIPGVELAIFDWHQDAGTWYATKHFDLAPKCPATLWTSINGASKQNAIEILPGSHLRGLEYHRNMKEQGRFKMLNPPNSSNNSLLVECEPGQGVMFSHLTVHRSRPIADAIPRYSLDIRYWSPTRQRGFPVSLPFKIRRWLSPIFP